MQSKSVVNSFYTHDWNNVTNIWEDYAVSANSSIANSDIKKLVIGYMDLNLNESLTRKQLRKLIAKKGKIKKHLKKEERFKTISLEREIKNAFNA